MSFHRVTQEEWRSRRLPAGEPEIVDTGAAEEDSTAALEGEKRKSRRPSLRRSARELLTKNNRPRRRCWCSPTRHRKGSRKVGGG